MSELSFFERIFSITNEEDHKVLNLLGISISVDRKFLFKLKYSKKPIDNKKIVFSNFNGNMYGCNPKYIAEEILRRKLPYKMVWLLNNNIEKADSGIPKGIKVVKSVSSSAIRELATSRLWISNVRLIKFLKGGLEKREGQKYIQTWHGSLGIKKIDGDANPTFWQRSTWHGFEEVDSKAVDYLTSNSEFENNVFKSAFWNRGEIVKVGHPRNDIFYFPEEKLQSIKEKVFSRYEINKDKKVLLYVPSYRDDYSMWAYNIEYKELVKTLKEKFGGDWVIMVRFHPRVKVVAARFLPDKDYIVNATDYPDIQEVLAAADIAVTDYSSCIFDFMLSRKPGFIYAPDAEDFDEERGFYYPLTSTPFPVSDNNEQLRKNISEFDYESYKQKVEDFLKEKGCIEDGQASARVVDMIEEIMK